MPKDCLTLKWGTLKEWHLNSDRGQELLKQYFALGDAGGAMQQKDTPEQKALICQIIDELDAPTVLLDWDDVFVSKDAAKRYVMEYQR